MTDHSITISNRVLVYGPGDVSYWGTMQWGTDTWGSDRDTDFQIEKVLSNSLSLVTAQDFDVTKLIANSISIATIITKSLSRSIGNTITISTDAVDYSLNTASGWKRYELGDDDLNDRNIVEYSQESATDPGYTARTPSTPTWEDA